MADISFILWLQQFSSDILDRFFILVTMIGNPEYYMIVIPLFYWCINKKETFRFTMFFISSMHLNTIIKGMVGIPRPPADQVRVLYPESTGGSASFPSGHAQGTTSFWMYATYYFKRKSIAILSIVVISLVVISRLYLGLHYPIDVLTSILLAVGVFILFNLLYDFIAAFFNCFTLGVQLILAVILPLFLLFLPGHDKTVLVGFSIGIIIGYLLEEKYVRYQVRVPLGQQIIKFFIGTMGILSFKILLKSLFLQIGFTAIAPMASDVIQYVIIGFWAAYLAPWLFKKLNL